MKYFFLLSAGLLISCIHFYLVWRRRDSNKYTLSEYAIIDKSAHALYFVTHIIVEVFFVIYSYMFFITEHGLVAPFYLTVSFAAFDFVQTVLPARGKTKKVHLVAAYSSWLSYLFAGVVALFALQISEPYKVIAIALLIPILGMFLYMGINRKKLYPYQLTVVPLFVIYMLLITIGAS